MSADTGCKTVSGALAKLAGALQGRVRFVPNPDGSVLALNESVRVNPAAISPNLTSLDFEGTGNTTTVQGAAFDLTTGGGSNVAFTFSNLALRGTAGGGGGQAARAIVATGGAGVLRLLDCQLQGFQATDTARPALDGLGGAVYTTFVLIVERTTIEGCQARNGGAIYADLSSGDGGASAGASLTDVILRRNTAKGSAPGVAGSGRGGGVFFRSAAAQQSGLLALDGGRVEANEASADGGGVVIEAADNFRVSGCVLRNNTAGTSGGALSVVDAAAGQVRQSAFLANRAADDGGAVVITAAARGAVLQIHDSTLDGNTASGGGGAAAALVLGDGTLDHDISLYSLTAYANSAGAAGSSLSVTGGKLNDVALANSILWANTSSVAEISESVGGSVDASSCIVHGGWAGATAIISADPQLGQLTDGGWRLPAFDGPAIDAGSMTAERDTVDQRNRPRVVIDVIDIVSRWSGMRSCPTS